MVVYIPEKLRKGQIRGIEQDIRKLFSRLDKLKAQIEIPTKRGKKKTRSDLEKKISSMISSSSSKDIVHWELNQLEKDAFDLRRPLQNPDFDKICQPTVSYR